VALSSSEVAEPDPRERGAYPWFLAGNASWFSAWGMQQVLFSWLVVGELHETAERAGFAVFALMIPTLIILLPAGATADRSDRRFLLALLHTVAALLVFALAGSVAMGALSFPLLIAYAMGMGTLTAFAVPARDSLINDVAGKNLLRTVVGATLVQFLAHGIGSLTGGVARYIGSAETLTLQGVAILLGAFAAYRLPRRISRTHHTGAPLHLREIVAGVREVLGSPVLRTVWALVIAVGLFFSGPYGVVFPLLVRDYYHGDVGSLSVLMMSFPLGSVSASLLLLKRGRLRRKGLALGVSQALAACALLVVGLGVPYAVSVAAGVAWGLCGGVFINTSRTLFQEIAPATHRARVLSVYNLGLMGAGTLGALLAGFLAGALGPLGAFLTCGCGMLLFVGIALGFTDLRHIES
jgi:MFS family permease